MNDTVLTVNVNDIGYPDCPGRERAPSALLDSEYADQEAANERKHVQGLLVPQVPPNLGDGRNLIGILYLLLGKKNSARLFRTAPSICPPTLA
jgi:hypothetical protein